MQLQQGAAMHPDVACTSPAAFQVHVAADIEGAAGADAVVPEGVVVDAAEGYHGKRLKQSLSLFQPAAVVAVEMQRTTSPQQRRPPPNHRYRLFVRKKGSVLNYLKQEETAGRVSVENKKAINNIGGRNAEK